MRKRSIVVDFAIVFILISMVFLTFFTYRLNSVNSSLIVKKMQVQEQIFANFFLEQINYNANVLSYMGRLIQQDTKSVGKENLNYINKLFKAFSLDPKIKDILSWTIIGWVDHKFTAKVDGVLEIIKKPIDLSDRDYLPITVKEPWKIKLGKPVIGSTSKKKIIPAGLGVLDKNGNYLGSLIIGFSLDSLESHMESLLEDKHFNIALIDSFGKVIINSANVFSGDAGFIANSIKEINNRKDRVLFKSSFMGLGDNYYISAIPEYNYYVVVNYSNKLSTKDILNILKPNWLEMLLFFLLLFFTVFVIKKYLIDILGVLANNAVRLAHGDLSIKLSNTKYKELYILDKAILRIKILKNRDIKMRSELENQVSMTRYSLDSLQKALQEKNKMIGQIIHDIRSPLNSVSGFLQIIRSRNELNITSEKIDEYIDDSINTVNHVIEVSDSMLSFEKKLYIGKAQDIEKIIVSNLLDVVVRMFISDANKLDIIIEKDYCNEELVLEANRNDVLRMVINLLSNSIKYSGNGKKIIVSLEETLNDIIIKITDYGIGIKDINEAVKAYSPLSKGNKSFGIGLFTIKEMIERIYFGKLLLISEEGVGTEAMLVFPKPIQ